MLDNTYKNAFKEVYEIIQNTDNELVNKIPQKFITFIQTNMNENYQTNINNNIEINKQPLLPETEDILALIYRSYWATEEEKKEFSKKDREELIKIEEYKKSQYKDINEIFEKKENIKNVTLDNSLAIIKKENIFKRLFNKILNVFIKN